MNSVLHKFCGEEKGDDVPGTSQSKKHWIPSGKLLVALRLQIILSKANPLGMCSGLSSIKTWSAQLFLHKYSVFGVGILAYYFLNMHYQTGIPS